MDSGEARAHADGRELPLHVEPVYFLRWELVTTARLYDALPADFQRIG
jgi:hypothetical protein